MTRTPAKKSIKHKPLRLNAASDYSSPDFDGIVSSFADAFKNAGVFKIAQQLSLGKDPVVTITLSGGKEEDVNRLTNQLFGKLAEEGYRPNGYSTCASGGAYCLYFSIPAKIDNPNKAEARSLITKNLLNCPEAASLAKELAAQNFARHLASPACPRELHERSPVEGFVGEVSWKDYLSHAKPN